MTKIQKLMRVSTESTCSLTEEEFLQLKADGYNQEKGKLNDLEYFEKLGYDKKYFESYAFDCKKCNNKGQVMQTDGKSLFTSNCSCINTRIALYKIRCDYNLDIKRFKFENYDISEKWQKEFKDLAIKFTKTENEWFFVGGQSGAGKTMLCTAILTHKIFKQNKSFKYFSWSKDSEQLKFDKDTADAVIDRLVATDVLYIDDLFKVKDNDVKLVTPADIKLVLKILDSRKNKTTIFSSEFNIADLRTIDEATAGRIYENCKSFCVNLEKDKCRNFRFKEQ